MAAAYTKLPVKGRRLGGTSRLFLAGDHLLSVETSLATENYIRFYFTDIQAVVTRRTDRGAIGSVLLFFLVFLFGTCTANSAALSSDGSALVWGIVTAPFLSLAVWNLWQGGTCQTHIQTAVGYHEVPALGRIRATNRILGRVRPLIDRAQGGVVSAAMIQERTRIPVADLDEEWRPEPAVHTESRTGDAPRSVATAHRVHLTLFLIMLATAAFDLAAVRYYGLTTVIAGLFLALAKLAAVITALVVQDPANSSGGVRRLTWWALGSVGAIMLMGYIYNMVLSISMIREAGGNPLYLYNILLQEGPARFPGLLVLAYVSAGLNSIIGALGLAALVRSRPRPAGVRRR